MQNSGFSHLFWITFTILFMGWGTCSASADFCAGVFQAAQTTELQRLFLAIQSSDSELLRVRFTEEYQRVLTEIAKQENMTAAEVIQKYLKEDLTEKIKAAEISQAREQERAEFLPVEFRHIQGMQLNEKTDGFIVAGPYVSVRGSTVSSYQLNPFKKVFDSQLTSKSLKILGSSINGHTLAILLGNNRLVIQNILTGKLIADQNFRSSVHVDEVLATTGHVFARENNSMASYLIDGKTGEKHTLPHGYNGVHEKSTTNAGLVLLGTFKGGSSIEVLDAVTFKGIRSLEVGEVTSAVHMFSGDSILVATQNGKFQIWNVVTGVKEAEIILDKNMIGKTQVSVSANQKTAYIRGAQNSHYVVDLVKKVLLPKTPISSDKAKFVVLNDTEALLIKGAEIARIQFNGQEWISANTWTHDAPLARHKLMYNNQYLLVADKSGYVLVIDVKSLDEVAKQKLSSEKVSHWDLSEDESSLIVLSGLQQLDFYNIQIHKKTESQP